MKLTISWISDKKKDITTKLGVKQKSSLRAVEYGDKYLDFWCSAKTDQWRSGQSIEVLSVEENKWTDKNGVERTSYEIKLPKDRDALIDITNRLERIESSLSLMRIGINDIGNHLLGKVPNVNDNYARHNVDPNPPMPDFGEDEKVNPDDVPF